MSSKITVEINLRPYLKEYIINRYGQEPVKASNANKIFPLLFPYLTKIPLKYKPLSGPGVIRFELPYNELIEVRNNKYINPRNFGAIQSYFYGLFTIDFTGYVNENVLNKNLPIKTSIISFCDEYNITYDFANYDSLKRIYLRYRDKARRNQSGRKKDIINKLLNESQI